MREDLVHSLACPECRASLSVAEIDSQFDLEGRRHLVDGLLKCDRGHRFPVIDEVPRLVRSAMFTQEERSFLIRVRAADMLDNHENVVPAVIELAEVERDLRRLSESRYGLGAHSESVQRLRAKSEGDYMVAEFRGANKRRYVRLLAKWVSSAQSILDIGGSLSGLMKCLCEEYQPHRAVVVDLDVDYRMAFKTAERKIALVRADAQNLPFDPGSFELVVSAFTLEHIPDWPKALRSMLHVGDRVLVAFGPNRWFPYEIGHLDAPLAGTLPKPLAAYVAYVWLRLIRRKRPLQRIREILAETNHIASRRFRHECQALGAITRNVFPEFVEILSEDREAPPSAPRQVIRAFPRTAKVLARVMSWAGVEPQMYYLLKPLRGTTTGGE